MSTADFALSPAEKIKLHRINDPELTEAFQLPEDAYSSEDECSSVESECTPRPLFMDDDEFDNDDYPATPVSCNSRRDYSTTPIMLNLPDEDDEGHHEALMSQRASRSASTPPIIGTPVANSDEHDTSWTVSPRARADILEHLESTQIRLECAQEVLVTAEQEKADLENQMFETEEDNVDLFEENELLKTENDRLAQLLHEAHSAQEEMFDENEMIKEKLEAAEDIIDAHAALHDRLEAVEEKETRSQALLAAAMADLQNAKDEILELRDDIHEAVEEQDLEQQDLAEQLEQAEREADIWRHHAQDLLCHVDELLPHQQEQEVQEDAAEDAAASPKPNALLEATIEQLRSQLQAEKHKANVAEAAAEVLARRSPRSKEDFAQVETQANDMAIQNMILAKRMEDYERQLVAHRDDLVKQFSPERFRTPQNLKLRPIPLDTPYDENDDDSVWDSVGYPQYNVAC